MGKIGQKESKRYIEIAEQLLADVREGRYAGCRSFPSLTKIMRRFGVTRVTAMRSVDELKKRGVISVSPRSGITAKRMNRTIGLILPGLAYSEFFSVILSEISRRCQQEGYGLMFGDVYPSKMEARAQRAKALAMDFARKRIAGVIFQPIECMPGATSVNKEIVTLLNDAGIPVVLLDNDILSPPERSSLDVVGINNFDAGRRIVGHLLSAGAKRIHFFLRCGGTISVFNRIAGVESALSVTGRDGQCHNVLHAEANDSDTDKIRAYLERWRPDAFVCGNDSDAAYLKHILDCLGKRVPEDIMLAGFDDIRYATVMTPQLTTIHQPCDDIASMAFKALQERIADPSLPAREILLSAPLVARQSTCRSCGIQGRKLKEALKCRK